MPDLIAVTGATGGIGGRVADRLAARGASMRLVVRDPSRAPRLDGAEVAQAAYDDVPAMTAALAGCDVMLFVSGHEHHDRIGLHRGVVEAAAAAGVRRVVYTSFVGASPDATFTFGRDHFHTENLIRAAGLDHTFLRDSMYLDFLPLLAGEDGVIAGPAGDGRFSPVARDDVADVATAALLDDRHSNRTYDLTGPELFTMHEVAERISAATGRSVRYQDQTLAEAYEAREPYGAPRWEVDGWVTSYSAIAAAELEVLSDDVERVTGHPPMTLEELLARGSV